VSTGWHTLHIISFSILLSSVAAFAQEPPPETNTNNAAQKAAAYVDQTIQDDNLGPTILFGDSEDVHYDPSGLPHYLRVDGIASVSKRSGSDDSNENGLSITSQFETQHYGAFSINGVFRNEPSGQAGVILQRKLPFNDGWFANNGVGTLYSPNIDLARNQYRFYIPTFPIFGVSTELIHKNDLQLQFSTGHPGLFNGLQLNAFSQLGGTVTMGGAQWNLSPQWQIGAQMVSTNDVTNTANSNTAFNQFFGLPSNTDSSKMSGQSFYGSAAWHNEDTRIQGNILQSDLDYIPSAIGVWLDAKKRTGRILHSAGLFRLEPNLTWGYTPISNDIEGLYYRANYNSRQWLLDGGIDAVKSVSGDGTSGTLLTGSVRYQVNQGLGIGGSATIRNADNNAQSGYVFTDLRNRYGNGRAQVDYGAEQQRHQTRVTASQNWLLAAGSRLNTALYTEVENNDSQQIRHVGMSLNGGSDLFNNLSWNGNLSYDKSNGSSNTRNLSANLDLSARLSNHWSLIASYLESKNKVTNPFIIDPLIQTQANTEVSSGSALFFTLRYETRSGTATAPLGGTSGSAAGSIAGYLFLDANDNNNPDANEEPAQNITVLLDGKFSTRTNALGRFEFPLVASGPHSIVVIADNLPLPWQIKEDGKTNVIVNTRETYYLNIPATRVK
jgi:hypothetical protein